MQVDNNALDPKPYDFILKDPQGPSGSRLPHLPKLAWTLLIGSLSVLFLVVLLALVFGNKSGKSDSLTTAAARAQEIIRVSKIAEDLAPDPATRALAATTETSLSSSNAQLLSYLSSNKIKVKPAALSSYLDKKVDSQMQSASTSGTLPDVYTKYLQKELTSYRGSLINAHSQAPAKAKPILNDAINSITTLLSSSQLATSNP